MKALLVLLVLSLVALPAYAVQTLCYSWEDGGTVLATYLTNLVGVANVSGAQNGVYGTGSAAPGGSTAFTCPGAYDGTHYLHVAEDPHSGTPSVVVAVIHGLVDGDPFSASVALYDPFEGNSTFPGMRIYGGYTSCTDPSVYLAGSGPAAYSQAEGWSTNANCSFSWTYNGVTYPDGCFRIEVRVYSTPVTANPQHTDYFIDYVCVQIPDHCTVTFPQGPSPVEQQTWSVIKALYR